MPSDPCLTQESEDYMAVDKCSPDDHDVRPDVRPGAWFCAVCGWTLVLGVWQPPEVKS